MPEAEDALFGHLRPGEKGAVLMVHFGSTYDETRAKTYDALNEAIRQIFIDHAKAAAATPWRSAAEEKKAFIQNNP